MKIIIGVFIFCLVLFIYLHIQFHLKTGEDLEMYEIEQPSKDKLEEICDLRQPVLFDFDSQKITASQRCLWKYMMELQFMLTSTMPYRNFEFASPVFCAIFSESNKHSFEVTAIG